MWKILTIVGAILTTVILVTVGISNNAMSQRETVYQEACSNVMSEHFHKKSDRVTGFVNGADGYTVLINIDEGPDLLTGKFKNPQTAIWGAECGFNANGEVFFIGIYDIQRQEFLIWTEPFGWQQIGLPRLSNKEKDTAV